jgi:hypothetical protein
MPTNKIPGAPVGIFRCRDLVTLYFGVRMVTSVIEQDIFIDSNVDPLILQDPRRIRYEIIIAAQPSSPASFFVGTPPSFDQGTSQQYALPENGTLIIVRDWITDGDAVTLALSFQNNTDTAPFVSTRETFLTPPGEDERLFNPFTGAPPR